MDANEIFGCQAHSFSIHAIDMHVAEAATDKEEKRDLDIFVFESQASHEEI